MTRWLAFSTVPKSWATCLVGRVRPRTRHLCLCRVRAPDATTTFRGARGRTPRTERNDITSCGQVAPT